MAKYFPLGIDGELKDGYLAHVVNSLLKALNNYPVHDQIEKRKKSKKRSKID